MDTDALQTKWQGQMGYAFPPFRLIRRILRKVRKEEVDLILITSTRPSQPMVSKSYRKASRSTNFIASADAPFEMTVGRDAFPYGERVSHESGVESVRKLRSGKCEVL